MLSIDLFPVLLRFLIGGSAVVASTVIAKNLGGRLGGIFAAFPAVYLAAVIGLSMDYKGSDSASCLRTAFERCSRWDGS